MVTPRSEGLSTKQKAGPNAQVDICKLHCPKTRERSEGPNPVPSWLSFSSWLCRSRPPLACSCPRPWTRSPCATLLSSRMPWGFRPPGGRAACLSGHPSPAVAAAVGESAKGALLALGARWVCRLPHACCHLCAGWCCRSLPVRGRHGPGGPVAPLLGLPGGG